MALTSDLWPLKTFSAISTHMINICAKFHWNHSTKYRDIVSCKIGVNGRTDGPLDSITPPPTLGDISMPTYPWSVIPEVNIAIYKLTWLYFLAFIAVIILTAYSNRCCTFWTMQPGFPLVFGLPFVLPVSVQYSTRYSNRSTRAVNISDSHSPRHRPPGDGLKRVQSDLSPTRLEVRFFQ